MVPWSPPPGALPAPRHLVRSPHRCHSSPVLNEPIDAPLAFGRAAHVVGDTG